MKNYLKKLAVKRLLGVVISVTLTIGLVHVGLPLDDAKTIGTAASAAIQA